MMVKGKNCKIHTLSTRYQPVFGLRFRLYWWQNVLKILFCRNSEEESAIYCMDRHACIQETQGVSLTRKILTDLLPTSPTKTYKPITELPLFVLAPHKTRTQISHFLKITIEKNPTPHPTSCILLKTPLGTLQFLFPISKPGLKNYLWFPDSREKALVRSFLDQISDAVVQIQMLALWYWHLYTWVFWTQ